MTKMNVMSPYVQELITKVIDPIERAGFQCYFVGGCVRDSLMGVTPHDYDLCTDALPIDLHEIFSEFSEKSSEERGVTMPVIELLGKREIVEIATFRKDGATIDGRHTYVEFGGISIDEDAQRRDLTINALYADRSGNIIDPTGFGVNDIKSKSIRFVGNAEDRIREDYLRAFRFCRFISKLGFTPVDYTWKLNKDSFKNVSKERQGDEFMKLLTGKSPSLGIKFMLKHGIFDAMGWSDEVSDLFIDQNPKYHQEGNVWEHTILAMREMEKIKDHDWIDMAAIFFHDFGKKKALEANNGKNMANHENLALPIVEKLLKDIKISNKDQGLILWLVEKHMRVNELYRMRDKLEIWKMLSDPRFPRLMRVGIADAKATINDGNFMPGVLERFMNPRVVEVEGKPMPKRLITGDTLLKMGFNHSDSCDFKKIIEAAYKNQINGGLDTVDKVLNSVRYLIK